MAFSFFGVARVGPQVWRIIDTNVAYWGVNAPSRGTPSIDEQAVGQVYRQIISGGVHREILDVGCRRTCWKPASVKIPLAGDHLYGAGNCAVIRRRLVLALQGVPDPEIDSETGKAEQDRQQHGK